MFKNNLNDLKKKLTNISDVLSDIEWEISSADSDIRDCRRSLDKVENLIPDEDEWLDSKYNLKVENLSDHFKFELVKEIYEKLELEEIQKLLNWKQGKGIDYEAIRKNQK